MNTTNVTNVAMSKKAASMKAVETLIQAHPVEMVTASAVETPVTVTEPKRKYQKKTQPANAVTSETSGSSPPPKRKYQRAPKPTSVPAASSSTEEGPLPKKKYQRKPKVTMAPTESTTSDPAPAAAAAPAAGAEVTTDNASPPKKKYYRKPKLTNTVIILDTVLMDSTLTNSVSVTNAPEPSPCTTTTAPELVTEEIFVPPPHDVGKHFETIHDIHTIQTFLLYLIEKQMIPLDSVPSILNTLLLKTKLSIIDTDFPTPITKHLIISELHTHLPNISLEHPAHEVVYNGRLMLLNHLNQMFDACDRSFYAYM